MRHLVVLITGLIAAAGSTQATTYTYTGAPYTTALPPYTVGQRLTGMVTMANPLPPFLPLTDITGAIASMSFDDGVAVRTHTDSFVCYFRVATDGAGRITRWELSLRELPFSAGNPQHAIDSTGDPGVIPGGDAVGTGNADVTPCGIGWLAEFANNGTPGSWSDDNPLSSTPTTYTYSGAPYGTATAPYATGGNVHGTITTANPLPPFLSLTDIGAAITSMSFSDGVATRTLADSYLCSFQVATDGAGNITAWFLSLRASPYTPGDPQHSLKSSGETGPFRGSDLTGSGNAGVAPCDGFALTTSANSGVRGSWTDTNPLASTPASYHYTGDPYTTALAPYTIGGRVTGTISTATVLPANLPLTDITPALQSLYFTDTVNTRTLGNSSVCAFRVATDGLGQITDWQIRLREIATAGNPQHSIDSSGVDLAGTGTAGANVCTTITLTRSGSTATQGTWTGGAAAATPIPMLDGLGLATLSLLLAAAAISSLKNP